MSTKGLKDFQMDLKNFGQKIMPGQHKKFCQFIALSALKGVIDKTPVDTGLAKGSWQVTEGAPATGQVETLDKTGAKTQSKGKTVIDKSEPMKNILFITNNLPYIEPLEDGHSKQAPLGMMQLTLEEIKAKAEMANVL